MKDANSLGGRWLQKELFQPKFEPCIENSGRKNLVFFKILGMRSVGEREREMLSGAEREEEGRERNETEIRDRKREGRQRNHTCINVDKSGLIDYAGNVICLPGCNVNSVYLKMISWKCIFVVFHALL